MTQLCSCTGASTLVRSRKQSVVVRCKNCGGMPLVDRTKLPSGSMLSTVGLEITSFINSDLTWKVSKGNRSSSRRARKSFSKSFNAITELVKKDPERVDMPVSESEKLGVSVLRCRFREKVENVPIKKRRFLYKSPSPPPQTPSPHPEDLDRFSKSHSDSGYSFVAKSLLATSVNDLGQVVDTEIDIDEKNMMWINKEHVETEDFSGISILAAAACSNSYGDDNGHAEEGSGVEEPFVHEGPFKVLLNNDLCTSSREISKEDPSSTETSIEGTGSSNSATPVEEQHATSLRTDSSPLTDVHHGNNAVECHSVEVIASKDLSSNKDETLVRKGSLQDDHSHWDLNTVMENWECPLNDKYADLQSNVDGISEKLQDGSCGNAVVYGRGIQPDTDKDMSFDMTGKTQQYPLEEKKLDVVPVTNVASCYQEILLTSKSICDSKIDPTEGREFLHFQDGITQNTGSADFVQADNAPRSPPVGEKNVLFECLTLKNTGNIGSISNYAEVISSSLDDRGITHSPINGPIDGSTADSDCDLKTFCLIQSSNTEHGIEEHNGKDAEVKSGALDDRSVTHPLISGHTNGITADSDCNLNEICLNQSSNTEHGIEKHNVSEEHPQEPSEAFLCSSSVSRAHNVHTDASDDAVKGNNNFGFDLQYGGCDSDAHTRLLGERDELEVDYDSQYEDGEVRDSILHTWEEYDREDAEVEHVDYGSDSTPTLTLDAGAPSILMNNQEADLFSVGGVGSGNKITIKTTTSSIRGQLTGIFGSNDNESHDEVDNTAVSGLDNVNRGNEMVARAVDCKRTRELDGSRIQMSSWDPLCGSSIDDSDKPTVLINDNDSTDNIGDYCMIRTGIKDSDMRRGFRRKLDSSIGEQSSYDMLSRKDRWSAQGSRYTNDEDSYRRFEMEFGHVKSFSRGRGYSPHVHARSLGGRHWLDSSENYKGQKKHSPNYRNTPIFRHPGSENGAYGRQTTFRNLCRRSGSPADRDEAFVMRNIGPPRERFPERNLMHGRGWSFRNGPQVNGRGLRGKFHRPFSGDCDDFNNPHPSTRRRRSVSPIDRRVHPRARRSHSKSRSRSRTRSPSFGFRKRSKSPYFRSDVRMQRLRSPNQRPGFGEERVVGFSSVPKRHTSPMRYFRWIDDAKGNVQFRKRIYDRSSSGLRSMHPGRLSELDRVDRGRFCYQVNDDDKRKNDCRYGFMRSPMRCDMDGGAGRRIQYVIEDDTIGAGSSRCRGVEFHGRGSPKDCNGRGSPKDCNGRGVNDRNADRSRVSRKESRTFVYQRDVKINVGFDDKGRSPADYRTSFGGGSGGRTVFGRGGGGGFSAGSPSSQAA